MLLRIGPPLAAFLIKLLMRSCRVVKVEGLEREREAASRSGGAVYATWHQRMAYLSHYFGARRAIIMISRSRDGEYATAVASRLGFRSVRGSSSRGGVRALKELIQRVKAGEIGGILADGPQGPARTAKMGSVWTAKNAKAPLIPVLWGADRCWMFNSWDRYLIPKPFAKIVVLFGEPLWIPASTKGEALEEYRRLFEQRLNEGARQCDEFFGAERPWRKAAKKGVPEFGPLTAPR